MESIERKNVPAQARRILEEGLRGDFNPLRERLNLRASAHDMVSLRGGEVARLR